MRVRKPIYGNRHYLLRLSWNCKNSELGWKKFTVCGTRQFENFFEKL